MTDGDMLPEVIDAEVVDGEHVREPEPGITIERYRDPRSSQSVVRVLVSDRWLRDAPAGAVSELEALFDTIAAFGRLA